MIDQATGKLEEGSHEDSQNNFQGRYAIRHEWTGAVDCKAPQRHIWGGPPAGEPDKGVEAGLDLAHAPRGKAQLAQLVEQDVPEIDVKAAGAGAVAATQVAGPPAKTGSGKQEPPGVASTKKGCGCAAGGDSGTGVGVLGLGIALALSRRRRSRV